MWGQSISFCEFTSTDLHPQGYGVNVERVRTARCDCFLKAYVMSKFNLLQGLDVTTNVTTSHGYPSTRPPNSVGWVGLLASHFPVRISL